MGLLNPRQIVTDAMSLAHANAVLVADFVKRQVGVGAYRPHSLPVQFGLMVLVCGLPLIAAPSLATDGFGDASFPAVQGAPSGNHVPHVVGLSAEYDVSGIYAGGVVAGVPANHSFRYWAVEQGIGDLGAVPSPSIINQLEAGVALMIAGLLPDPAPIIANKVISMKSLNKAVTPHNISPAGGFPIHYTGKGG